MSNELQFQSAGYSVQHSIWAVIYNASLQVWNGSAFVALSGASTAGVQAMALLPGSTTLYVANLPAGVPRGASYTIDFVDAAAAAFNTAIGQQVLYVPVAAPTPPTPPTSITSSKQMVGQLQQQLAYVANMKIGAIAGITSAIAAGAGPSYSIGSPDGSKSVSMEGYLRFLKDTAKEFTELERMILEMLQDLQPFVVVQPQRIRGCW